MHSAVRRPSSRNFPLARWLKADREQAMTRTPALTLRAPALPQPRRALAACLLGLALAAAALALGPARAEAAAPPRGFMGVTAWDPVSDTQFKQLGASNVRLYRMLILWKQVEPRPPRADGTHVYDWSYYDGVFTRAARRGIRIMPLLHGSPSWAASRPTLQPTSTSAKAAFDAFAKAAAKRYGPAGTLWSRAPWSSSAPAVRMRSRVSAACWRRTGLS